MTVAPGPYGAIATEAYAIIMFILGLSAFIYGVRKGSKLGFIQKIGWIINTIMLIFVVFFVAILTMSFTPYAIRIDSPLLYNGLQIGLYAVLFIFVPAMLVFMDWNVSK